MKLIVFQMLYCSNCYCYIFHPPAKPLCLIYFYWYSGPDPVVFEAEPEEAVGEPQRVIEWQPDDVL